MPKVLNKHTDDIPEGAVYVGRPTKWGNPFIVGRDGPRGVCVEMHKEYIVNAPELLSDLHELRGKDLVCFCAPRPCHADILLKLANE